MITRLIGYAIFVLLTTAGASTAWASTSDADAIADLQRTVAALAARVATLESQLQSSNVRTQQAETSTPQPILASLNTEMPTHAPMRLGGSDAQVAQTPNSFWSGPYWGASFGYGASSSSTQYRSLHQEVSRYGSRDSSSNDRSISIDHYTWGSEGRSSGNSEGALSDLYVGLNVHLTPRLLAGAQIEGSLASLSFGSLNGPATTHQTSTTYDKEDQETRSSAEKGRGTPGFSNDIDLGLMVSALGRVGWLARPTTMLYGVAGWTYGRFSVESSAFPSPEEFGSHGVTVGGGVEQQLSSKWSIRAEYRFTDFGDEDLSSVVDYGTNSSRGRDSDGDRDFDSYKTTGTSHATISNDMQIGRIGVTRYFSAGE